MILILSGYTGLYLLSKLIFGGKKKEEAAPAVAPVVEKSSSEIPGVDDPSFDTWIEQPGNGEKYFNSKFEE